MSEYHAAVAMASLDKWPETRVRHLRIADWYRRAPDVVDGGVLQPDYGNGWVGSTTSVAAPAGKATRISLHLKEAGVDAPSGRKDATCSRRSRNVRAGRSVTEDLGRRVLGLPHSPDMQEKDVARVAQVLSEVVRPKRLARALELPGYEGLPAPVSATAPGTSDATSRDMPLPDHA